MPSRVLINFIFTDIIVIIAIMGKDKIEAIKTWLGSGSINVFGPPFSGKDTQGQKLSYFLVGSFFSGGQILRESPVSENLKQKMLSGRLAPIDEYLHIVLPFLKQPEYNGKPIFLSAFGRWHGEEYAVEKALLSSEHTLKVVIFLALPEEEIWERYKAAEVLKDRGERRDDTKESLVTRIEEFKSKTLPVAEYYRQKGLLIEVNGNQSPEAVTKQIINKLYEFSRASASSDAEALEDRSPGVNPAST